MVRVEVLHEDVGHAGVGGQGSEEPAEGFQPARRCPDADDGERAGSAVAARAGSAAPSSSGGSLVQSGSRPAPTAPALRWSPARSLPGPRRPRPALRGRPAWRAASGSPTRGPAGGPAPPHTPRARPRAGAVALAGHDLPHEVVTRLTRHGDVAEEHVRHRALERRQRLRRRSRDGDHGALTLQDELQDLADVPVVVHDEDTDAGQRALVCLDGRPACRRLRRRCRQRQLDGEGRALLPRPGSPRGRWPPWSSTRSFTSARPTPSPPCARVLEPSAWRKRSKRLGRTSGLIPDPLSITRIRASTPARSRRTSTRPPAGVNLIAFATRLATIWLSRCGSAMSGVTDSSRTASSRIDFCSARGRSARMAAWISFAGSTARRSRRRVARGDAREVEEVVDELGLRAHAALDRLERSRTVGLAGLRRAKGVGPGEDRVERRPELVRDQGEELVLGPVGRLGGLPRLLELARSLRLQSGRAQHGKVGGQLRRDHREPAHVLRPRRRLSAPRTKRTPTTSSSPTRGTARCIPAARASSEACPCSSTSRPSSAVIVAMSPSRSAGGVPGATRGAARARAAPRGPRTARRARANGAARARGSRAPRNPRPTRGAARCRRTPGSSDSPPAVSRPRLVMAPSTAREGP